jgi:hypothetical protein
LTTGPPSVELGLYAKNVILMKGARKRSRIQWSLYEDGPFDRVEAAALQYFTSKGFSGVHDEGQFINQTIRAAMLCDLKSDKEFMNFSGGFTDPRNLFAQGLLLAAKDGVDGRVQFIALSHRELVQKIRGASKEEIFDFIHADAKKRRFHASPPWNEGEMRRYSEFLNVVGCEFLANIAERQNATGSYAGFPDLTLWRGSDLKFIEVKAPGDRLTPNQMGSFFDVLLPLGIDLCIANIKEVPRWRIGADRL